MRHYLLPEGGNFYKANLHTHSIYSDGARTVEEIKRDYMAHGYSVVAFTDHDIMLDHSDLNEPEKFLALTSYEVETNPEPDGKPWNTMPTYHLNFYASRPDETCYPCGNPCVYLRQRAEVCAGLLPGRLRAPLLGGGAE